ncbi:hypothetical protein EYF80_015325 [Liparis tanakae]|uniref:Uncharacterized protein n=1 Tax=Liparis tanakae TaxID=230148 RepID=A0A4Z2IAW1_9TELE|nr:hypothetical protein EYF80_015325 [Liparis tanakae]
MESWDPRLLELSPSNIMESNSEILSRVSDRKAEDGVVGKGSDRLLSKSPFFCPPAFPRGRTIMVITLICASYNRITRAQQQFRRDNKIHNKGFSAVMGTLQVGHWLVFFNHISMQDEQNTWWFAQMTGCLTCAERNKQQMGTRAGRRGALPPGTSGLRYSSSSATITTSSPCTASDRVASDVCVEKRGCAQLCGPTPASKLWVPDPAEEETLELVSQGQFPQLVPLENREKEERN